MPIYEYRCARCSHRFDFLHRSSRAPAPRECPKCGAKKPSRIFSTFGVTSGASPGASPANGNGGGSCCSGGGCGCRS
ncbi:MAG: zinc ribbon domain-containing protein [Planctomycetes bacterium]|nr:zinc ribbon domain-containing protein [Planctomycetota bacterium]MBI3843113.1 zinc ribbon domain-containing protein [Planctomycetota bacterium]